MGFEPKTWILLRHS